MSLRFFDGAQAASTGRCGPVGGSEGPGTHYHALVLRSGAAAAGRAGCQCLPVWSYTSSKGVTYTISNGTCQNPDGEWNTFWCYVDQVGARVAGLKSQVVELSWTCIGPSMPYRWCGCPAVCALLPSPRPSSELSFSQEVHNMLNKLCLSCLPHLFVLPWAQTTCTHPPFTFNGGVRSAAWDSCMAQNLTRTIDSGVMQLPACACVSCVHRRCGRSHFPKLPACLCGAVGSRFKSYEFVCFTL